VAVVLVQMWHKVVDSDAEHMILDGCCCCYYQDLLVLCGNGPYCTWEERRANLSALVMHAVQPKDSQRLVHRV
jgi:hypothetical protein